MNALKTTLLILALPGFMLIVIPTTLLVPQERNALAMGIFAWIALPFWLAGLGVMLWCAADFVRKGQGTPAPIDPPKKLVTSGLYRYVRNPMYLGALLFSFGNVLWYGSPLLLGYVAFLWMGFQGFIFAYEEPHLRKTFGQAYLDYCQATPRWIPRRKR